MSAVSEWIVREYFESLGFLVRQPRKYQVSARPKQVEEEIDLLVVNPAVAEQKVPAASLWAPPTSNTCPARSWVFAAGTRSVSARP